MKSALFAAGLCLLLLGACSSKEQGTRPAGLVLVNVLSEQVRARQAPATTQVNAAAILQRKHLAAIGQPLIRITPENSGVPSLLYISQRNGAAQIWKTPDNISFTLRDGIITQTRGLGYDIYATDTTRLYAALKRSESTAGLARSILRLDGSNAAVPFTYRCEVASLGPETVRVLGQSFATRHFRESCTGADGSFQNDYWIDSHAVMRVSHQWISTEFGYVRLERLID